MSAPEQLLRAQAEAIRHRALVADRAAAEWLALAKAGAVVGKRVPDKLAGEVRSMASSGELRRELLQRIGAPPDADLPEAYVRSAEELLLAQTERFGEYLTDVTQSAVKSAAEQRGMAAAFREVADLLDALAPALRTSAGGEVPQSRGEPALAADGVPPSPTLEDDTIAEGPP